MTRSRRRPSRLERTFAYLLFAIVMVVALWVPAYNHAEPRLFGIPFFHWFQFVWIVAAAISTAVAYKLGL
jgi:hypothetical protein